MKHKKLRLMKGVKDTMKVGVASMAGMGAMGVMTKIPGMPSQAGNIAGITGSALTLANVGQLGKTGMGIVSDFGSKNKKYGKCKVIKRILG